MKTYSDRCADTTKNIDVVDLGCYDKSTYLANCPNLLITEKLWNLCGSPMTSGMSMSLEKIETSSRKCWITSKHTFAYARVTGLGQSTKRLFSCMPKLVTLTRAYVRCVSTTGPLALQISSPSLKIIPKKLKISSLSGRNWQPSANLWALRRSHSI